VLTTYGLSSGNCVDPVEKKPLNHFLPGSAALSFGTAGCNLGCRFCQNWDISKSRETDTLADAAAPPAIAQAAARLGCRVGRVHLQRPGYLPRIRHRRGRRMPPGRHQDGGGDGRVHVRRAARGRAGAGRHTSLFGPGTWPVLQLAGLLHSVLTVPSNVTLHAGTAALAAAGASAGAATATAPDAVRMPASASAALAVRLAILPRPARQMRLRAGVALNVSRSARCRGELLRGHPARRQ
jgi:hypothetical protein